MAQLCERTCGNSTIDTCYTRHDIGEACPEYTQAPEACDHNSEDCSALGYLGGTAMCTTSCSFDVTTCSVCETTGIVVDCEATDGLGGTLTVTTTADGPELAVAGAYGVTLYRRDSNGLVLIGDNVAQGYALAAPYPNGWIMTASDGVVVTMGADGTVGSVVSDGTPVNATRVIAYGNGRVLQAWAGGLQQPIGTQIRIFDTSLNLLVGPTVMSTAPTQTLAATSDGTSFFVMTAGQITRIGMDGTVLGTTPGYPTFATPRLFAWGTTGGWFAGATGGSPPFSAQRFDATGTAVGAPIGISDPVLSFAVDGDDLLATIGSGTPAALALERITPAGMVTRSSTIGIGVVADGVFAARFGPDVVVSWFAANRARLARVAF